MEVQWKIVVWNPRNFSHLGQTLHQSKAETKDGYIIMAPNREDVPFEVSEFESAQEKVGLELSFS